MKTIFHILFGAVCVVLLACSGGKVDVVIKNACDDTVDRVLLDWEGETVPIGSLAHGATSKKVIHPHIESPLTVRYHRGGQFLCINEAYFTKDWTGVIHVLLMPTDTAEFTWTGRNGHSSSVTVACTEEGL